MTDLYVLFRILAKCSTENWSTCQVTLILQKCREIKLIARKRESKITLASATEFSKRRGEREGGGERERESTLGLLADGIKTGVLEVETCCATLASESCSSLGKKQRFF
jgi:hypothetical protein